MVEVPFAGQFLARVGEREPRLVGGLASLFFVIMNQELIKSRAHRRLASLHDGRHRCRSSGRRKRRNWSSAARIRGRGPERETGRQQRRPVLNGSTSRAYRVTRGAKEQMTWERAGRGGGLELSVGR